ncbi:MAG TPA: thioesterase family protein [Bacteroidota bacterium]|nr:thioesterase family protein [Bacteroidota bacterium]
MDRERFKFQIPLTVRNYEVDWQGIVHNANYLHYFETGRIEYLRHLGVALDMQTIQHSAKVVLVRNEINYRSPARFDDAMIVRTRLSAIRNSSFLFEGILELAEEGRLLAENLAWHVWLNPGDDRPMRVPEYFREIILGFEGADLSLGDPGGPA